MKAQARLPERSTNFARPRVFMIIVVSLWTWPLAISQEPASREPGLTKVIDLPLPGKPSRFDYQSYDPKAKRLYFSHMGDGELLVLDTETRKIVAHLPGFPTTTGVLVVPEDVSRFLWKSVGRSLPPSVSCTLHLHAA